MMRIPYIFGITVLLIFMVSCQSGSKAVDAFEQNEKLGRGVNILGYDPIWDSFEKARFKEHHFKLIREAGFNTVRINLHPFRHMDPTTFELREHWWKVLDWAVENALANGLMIILDMHEYYAMADDPVARKDMWLTFWKQVAERYQDSSDDVLFELLNEPNGKLNSELWNDFLLEGLAVVRNSNPHRTVIIGPAQYNQINQLDSLILPEKDRNIIVTIHYYSPMAFTHQGASWVGRTDSLGVQWLGNAEEKQAILDDFAQAQNWSKKHNRPLFLGEFGVYDKADMESRTKYLSFVTRTVENLGWSWAYWQFDSDFILYDIDNEHWIEPVLKALIPKTAGVN
ncbi:MAG TPA: glycoside hydrolase family 5 protein [Candidatus Marinimicrobia bacterium]|nr:glycoside hydrolase family 5 protein [Candidatus Neomarinimicrobiota bacterium]